jgi:hypothetical protein
LKDTREFVRYAEHANHAALNFWSGYQRMRSGAKRARMKGKLRALLTKLDQLCGPRDELVRIRADVESVRAVIAALQPAHMERLRPRPDRQIEVRPLHVLGLGRSQAVPVDQPQ